MALLGSRYARGTAAPLLALGLAACAQDGRNGVASVDIFEREVVCSSETGSCNDPLIPSQPVAPDDLQRSGLAFVSRAASQYGEGGLYLYLELQRPGGLTGALELDLPTGGSLSGQAPHAVYQELRDGRPVFRSSHRAGRIELPSSPDCPCQDLLLELVFTDLGADGVLGTADDQTRRLSRGVVGAGDALCLFPRILPIAASGAIEVGRACHALPAQGIPWQGGSSGGSSGSGYRESVEVGCAAEPESYDDSGCDGSGGDSGYDESSGCDGGGSDYDDSSSGCDSGGSDWGDSGSGCEGDGAAAPSCEGDAFAALGAERGGAAPRRAPFRARLLGTVLPFALFGLFTVYLRRRSRRR